MAIERDETLCKYNGGSCSNKRAERNNGPLRVCEFHRHRANVHQKKYQQRQKQQRQLTVSSRPLKPLVVQALNPAAAAPAPLVVFVLVNEKVAAASLEQLSAVLNLHVGQPFQVVWRECPPDWPIRSDRGEAISTSGTRNDTSLEEANASTKMAHAQELEPLPLDVASDAVDLRFDEFSWPGEYY